jgi:hypothetical protein
LAHSVTPDNPHWNKIVAPRAPREMSLLFPLLFAAAHVATPATAPSPRPPPLAGEHAGMQCNGNLVQLGASQAAVVLKCGEPMSKTMRWEQYKLPNGVVVTIAVEEWTYYQGKGAFLRLLTFKDGTLTDVRLGEYVS